MADECCRCTNWNEPNSTCYEKKSPFFKKVTEPETACDQIEKGTPMQFKFKSTTEVNV